MPSSNAASTTDLSNIPTDGGVTLAVDILVRQLGTSWPHGLTTKLAKHLGVTRQAVAKQLNHYQ